MPNERIGAQEGVTALIGDPLSRHIVRRCAHKKCWRRTYFNVEGNFSSRFCPKHTENRAKKVG